MFKSIFYFMVFSIFISFFVRFLDNIDHPPLSEGVQVSLAMKGDLMVRRGLATLYRNKKDYVDGKPLFTCELSNVEKHCFFYGPKGSFESSVAVLKINEGYLKISGKNYPVDGLFIHSGSYDALSKSYKISNKKGAGLLYRAPLTLWNDVVFQADDSSAIWTNTFDMLVWFTEDDYAPMSIAWKSVFNLALDVSERDNLELSLVIPLAIRDMSDSKIDGLYFGEEIAGWNLTSDDLEKSYSYYMLWAGEHKDAYDAAIEDIVKAKNKFN